MSVCGPLVAHTPTSTLGFRGCELRIIITSDYDEMSRIAASIIAMQVRSKSATVLGLATGSTPLGTYKELVRLHNEEGLDFSRVRTFNLDEYVGLKPEHPQSYHSFMFDNFFKWVNVNSENVWIPDGMTRDVAKFCVDYEERIKKAGGIDIQLLGIGRDGHIGFNEPGSSLGSRTRLKTLAEETVSDNARFFGGETTVPRLAITMGVGTILESRKLVMLASGAEKAEAVEQAVEGPITSQVTASALQLHPSVFVVLDEEAAKRLKRTRYYSYVERIAEQIEGEGGI
jgi:glucosamine-6-phosphate deaminase